MFYGLYWFLVQGVLYLAQFYFQIERPDPYCAVYHTYAYPSSEVYYSVSLVAAILTWTVYYRVQHSLQAWLGLYVLLFVPSILLWFFQMNRWWEVLWTALMAVASTVPFTLLLIEGVTPNIDYIENCSLMSWYGWNSTFFRRQRNPKEVYDTRNEIRDSMRLLKNKRK